MTRLRTLLIALVVAAIVAVGAGLAANRSGKATTTAASSIPVAAALQNAFRTVYAKVSPSVVQIETSQGLGSGIVFDNTGDIVTNAHVVGTAKTFTVTTSTKGLWSTDPPSAGGHYGLWAVWGFYRQPVNPRQVVHNEEHGAVVMWWGPKVPASTVDQLQAFYNKSSDGMFGTPYPSLGNKIALTAWTGDPNAYYVNHNYGIGHIAICPTFDEKAFAAFRDAYRGKGPEGIPLSNDQQGMGPQ